ncbi:hypothetical protein GUA87_09405 [Sneathiella sp. P13V-1]|uniref:hypothetical protein n=1 Tax=Sneathiella sp. P13V-1 TaxID=2697366 RepID=UPI00187B572D|nr:hypothetical protein [Sneathiella sp. P13V-1]MBE7637059.1 hypothetical protein [Sneathiella sp. P13V-1]
MYRFDIKKIVRRSFELAVGLTEDVNVVQHSDDSYVPGEESLTNPSKVHAKYMKVKEFGGFSKIEEGPVFQNSPIIGWLWCEEAAPLSGDELEFENSLQRIVQVRSLDHGAGSFYEVWTE